MQVSVLSWFGRLGSVLTRFGQMRVSVRLTILSCVLLGLLVVTNGMAIYGLTRVSDALNVSYEDRTVPMVAMGKALDENYRARSLLNTAIDATFQQDMDAYMVKSRKADQLAQEYMELQLEKLTTPEEKRLGDQYRQKWAAYAKLRKDVIHTFVDEGDGPTAKVLMRGDHTQAFDALIISINELFQYQEAQAKKGFEAASGDAKRIRSANTVLMLAGFAIAALLSIWIIRSIVTPLRKAIRIAEKISRGDLTSEIEVAEDGKDETARLMRSLVEMQSSLKQVIRGIHESAETLSTSSSALSGTFRFIADGSEQQSEAAQAIASAIEEMTVSFDQVNHNTVSALETAESTVAVSAKGQSEVTRASEDIHKIVEAVQEAGRSIESLERYSLQINGIAAVIKEIADQTNLLALNAAIEAARAGEHGRGFAVVADEVRKLAEKTTQATGNIQSVLKTVQTETARASNAMVVSSQQVTIGVEAVSALIPTFNQLIEGAEVARSDLNDLAQSTKEQAITSSAIAQSVERIAQMTERNNVEINTTNSTVRELERLSGELKEAVDRFVL